jgi:TRAP-type C4-dicarboxylate transport system substrate-binding protein
MSAKRLLWVAIAAVAAIGLVAASAATPQGLLDKSGGSTPVTLTLLNDDNSDLTGVPAVQRFIDRVRQLSGGTITINVQNGDWTQAHVEQQVVRDVQANTVQLAWVGTRVWDTLGVNAFRALHAPMLVDSYQLEKAVLQSSLPAKMLADFQMNGIVPLALLADNLRYIAAARHPLRTSADLHGARIGGYASATQAAAFRAIGARPVVVTGSQKAHMLKSGRLDAIEIDLKTYMDNGWSAVAPFVTVNAALWPRTTLLIASSDALSKLSGEQSSWISQAAADAAAYSLTTLGEDQRIIPFECRHGMKAVVASPTQLAALRAGFAPAYATLRHDPATADMVDSITALKHQLKPTPLAIPKSCLATPKRGTAATSPSTFPEGIYRFRITHADILRVWPDADATALRAFPGTMTYTFRRGIFNAVGGGSGIPGCHRGDGKYTVSGNTLTVIWTNFHGCRLWPAPSPPVRLRWRYDGSALHFHILGTAEPDDVVTWEAKPFIRIR